MRKGQLVEPWGDIQDQESGLTQSHHCLCFKCNFRACSETVKERGNERENGRMKVGKQEGKREWILDMGPFGTTEEKSKFGFQ